MNDTRFTATTLVLVVCVGCVAVACAFALPSYWPELLVAAAVATGAILVFSHERPFAFYLKFIYPVVALVVFAVCLYAASIEFRDGKINIHRFYMDNLSSYFVAKGLFCSTAVFLLGKLIEVTMAKNEIPY